MQACISLWLWSSASFAFSAATQTKKQVYYATDLSKLTFMSLSPVCGMLFQQRTLLLGYCMYRVRASRQPCPWDGEKEGWWTIKNWGRGVPVKVTVRFRWRVKNWGRGVPVKVIVHGMTIRTARLPGAGNLLGRAGEDLSGLPDWASRYHFFFLLTVSYFNSSTRFQVTVTVFVSWFHNRNISFPFHHQTDRLQCRSMWLACQCS